MSHGHCSSAKQRSLHLSPSRLHSTLIGSLQICVISFSGAAHVLFSQDPGQKALGEFIGSALSIGDLLVIADNKCTFGNGLDVEFIAETFAKW